MPEDFCAAFGDSGTTLARLQEAIVFYESGLVAGSSAVDRHRFLGEPLSESAQRGLALFATKARCIGCHRPPLYTDGRFHDNAQGNDTDPGRAFFTARDADLGKFRTMSLATSIARPPTCTTARSPPSKRSWKTTTTAASSTFVLWA